MGLKRVVELWDVVVEAHSVGAYAIEELRISFGGSEEHARLEAVREAHRRHGVAPWKPYIRQSWPHTKATKRTEAVPA